MANSIITRDEYKTYAGISGTTEDARIDLLLPGVERAIVDYTERDFTETAAAGTRQYLYDGSGVLEINDAQAVTQVSFINPSVYVLPATTYILQQQNGVYTWIEMPVRPGLAMSPEMGFTFNLDQYWWRTPQAEEPTVEVTGTFGWVGSEMPANVKQAAYWTMEKWLEGGPDLDSEAIADYSRSFAVSAPNETYAIPSRARDLLNDFKRDG